MNALDHIRDVSRELQHLQEITDRSAAAVRRA
jgi:hypothetical protein